MTKSYAKLDLHEALSSGSYDHAVMCTYTFEPSFFEQHCLEKFKSLSTNGNITLIIDRHTYEQLLNGDTERPKRANIRYLLHPVLAGGVFHPKIYLLARRNKGRLIIGSANLTRNGITSNAEMAATFEYEEDKNQGFKPLFTAVFKYFLEIAQRFPAKALQENLNEIVREVPWLTADNTSPETVPEFLNNLEEPILTQVYRKLSSPVDTVYVLSRYFDGTPSLLDEIERSVSPKKIKIFSQNGITNMTPEWLSHPLVKANRAAIFLCRFFDDEHAQPLHAKAMIFETAKRCAMVFGSANFTSAAMLRTIKNGNAETVLIIKDIPSTILKPSRLFDPSNNAFQLKSPEMLHRSPKEDPGGIELTVHTLRLYEASVIGDVISISADIPDIVDHNSLVATLKFQNFADRSLKVDVGTAHEYIVRVSEVEKERLDNESTMIQLEVREEDKVTASSNWLLITNLKEIKTNANLRKGRQLKEAEQSAVQFFAVLRELLQAGDEEALLRFLNFCDIPLVSISRPFFFRRKKPEWDGGAEMKALGARNLKIYKELHEASLSFFDRHFRKLRRHSNERTLVGVSNFLHIFLAMGHVLRTQMERSVIGLESIGKERRPEQWGECRRHWDTYFDRFRQLMACLEREYLSPMIREHGLDKIKIEFEQDLKPIHDLCCDMLNYRDRIEMLRLTKLKEVVPGRPDVVPSYFYSVLSAAQWPKYSREVRGALDQVERTLDYAA